MFKRTIPAATALAWCCAIGTVAVLVTACHVAAFVMTGPPPSPLSDPLQMRKLVALLALFAALAVALGAATWRTWRTASVQREVVSDWSPVSVLLCSLVCGFLLLVYYPLPSHRHHLDKLLFLIGTLFGWSGWFALHPRTLAKVLNTRMYARLKVGLVNVLVFVVTVEVILRLADPVLARGGLFETTSSPTSESGRFIPALASLKPNREVVGSIGHSNSQGFRDRERTFERIGSGARIVALGDSFTWGAGVSYDETFVTLLERRLQTVIPGSEIINLGVPGFEVEHYFHLLTQYGIRFRPDLVMLNFYVGNDIMRKRGADVEKPVVVAGQSYYVHRNGNWVHDHLGPDRWYLYHDLNYVIRMGGMRFRHALGKEERGLWDFGTFGVPGASGGANPGTRWHPRYLQNIDERSEVFLKEDTPLFTHHWTHTRATLDSLHEFLQVRGVPLLMILIPDHVQLDHGLQRAYLASIGASLDRYDFHKPQRLLRAWAMEHQVPVVDLLLSLEQEAAPETLYIRNDTHWTSGGHALAAVTIRPALEEEILHLKGTRVVRTDRASHVR